MDSSHHAIKKTALWVLILGALGVVYGDIGTSPLYAVNEIFFGHGRVPFTPANIIGSIGLIIWVLTLVVTLKYVALVLLANHEGEGGVFALLSLLSKYKKTLGIALLTILLVLAAGLLFGDGLITPAISILSAVEGLSVATTIFTPYIIPITAVILAVLFGFQYKGTSKVGMIFGPIMIVWFTVIALLGLHQIILHPYILEAFNPLRALEMLHYLGFKGTMLIFGAVVLAVTGGEALYADLGHFGLTPIRISWLAFVFPALILNYLGQGAFLLSVPATFHGNVFYSMVPASLIYPMVILATCATVIASQALISGAYSLTAQAVALNFLPRFKINYTNKQHEGQIYVPAINWVLFLGSLSLVFIFKSSSGLASAYGLAVSGVMLATSLAMLPIAVLHWHWKWWQSGLLFGAFALIDSVFLISNSLKFFEGGYVPIAIGLVGYCFMMTWHWGRTRISDAYSSYAEKRKMSYLAELKHKLETAGGHVEDERGMFVEVDRTVLFLVNSPITSPEDPMPVILRSHMRHNGSLPRYTILLHISRGKKPYIRSDRYTITEFGNGLLAVEARFGFMEDIEMETVIKYLDAKTHIPGLNSGKYLIKAGSEELILDRKHVSLFTRVRTLVYRTLQMLASPTYYYFGLDIGMSLSTVAIQMFISDIGATISIPELDLGEKV